MPIILITLAFASAPAAYGGLTYVCNPNVDTMDIGSNGPQTDSGYPGTCAYLNNQIAGMYDEAFSNLNATIYVTMGGSGLGSNFLPINYITYSQFISGLTANQLASGDAIEQSALTALATYDAPVYGNGYVTVTGALGLALGIPAADLYGFTSSGAECLGLGSGSGASYCYDDIIYITNPNTENGQQLWWRQEGGTIPSDAYDFYSVVEHETDEALGTASCIDTQTGTLTNWCGPDNNGVVNGQSNTPSAADLFRYSSAGQLVLDSSFSTTPGAYFSYNGGLTNGANGAVYNTAANGADYGDYANNCQFVQDAYGCTGESFDVNTDGGELPILEAEGFMHTPEPGTLSLLAAVFALAAIAYRRRKAC